MKKTSNNLSALFRSLGPDEAGLEAIAKNAAPKVEKEWPLFKAVPPTEQQPTPPLSSQERKIWSKQAKVKVEVPRPTLSMSGLSSKLAKSLSQISEQMVVEAHDMDADLPEKRSRVNDLFQEKQGNLSARKSKLGGSLSAKSLPAVEPLEQEEDIQKTEVTEKAEPDRPAPAPVSEKAKAKSQIKTQDAGERSDRLANIFSRLEEQEKVVVKPVEKRSSLSKRMGKR